MVANRRLAWGLFGAALAFGTSMAVVPRVASAQAAPTGRRLPTPTPTPAPQPGKGLLVVPTPTPTPAAQKAKTPPHSREFVIGFTGSTPVKSREVRIDFVGKPVSPARAPRP